MKPMKFTEKPLGEGTHWRKFYDSRVLRWWHLPPKDITLLIETITELDGKVGKDSKRQLLARFRGARLPFAFNATNCTTMEQLYGADPHGWSGKRVTLYVTETEMPAERGAPKQLVNCIRIRPHEPRASRGNEPEAELNESAPQPSEPNPEEDGRG
jgi:hypothetical protein